MGIEPNTFEPHTAVFHRYVTGREPYGEVYLITNTVNGKQYVGQTKHNAKIRWKGHVKSSRHSKPCCIVDCAINKYGVDKFTVSTIAYANCIDSLNHLEEECIKIFETLAPNGYNARASSSVKEGTYFKIGEGNRGKKRGWDVALSSQRKFTKE